MSPGPQSSNPDPHGRSDDAAPSKPSVRADGAPDDATLERYWFGRASAAESASVEQWLAEEPERRARYAAFRHLILEGDEGEIAPNDAQRRTAAIVAAIAPAPNTLASRPVVAQGIVSRRLGATAAASSAARSWRAAALASLVCVMGGVAAWWSTHRTRAVIAPAHEYVTRLGQQATIVLADGSRVRLAPRSRLRIEPGFGSAERRVSLEGEAYFAVRHAEGAAFLVQTGATTTRVLGTAFDVQHYAHDPAVRVTVSSGKVFVGGATSRQPSLVLTEGMTGLVNDSSAVTVAADQAPYMGWIDGQLVFHKARTADVLAVLTQWYGYQFRLADSSLARQNLTLGLSTESSSAALATLKQVLDVELTFDHDVVTLHPKHDLHAVPRDSRDAWSPNSTEVGR